MRMQHPLRSAVDSGNTVRGSTYWQLELGSALSDCVETALPVISTVTVRRHEAGRRQPGGREGKSH